MSDLKRDSVELPLVEKNSEYIDYIKEYATDEIDDKGSVVSVLNEQQYANRVAKFKEISALQDSITDDTNDLEEVLEQIMKTVSGTVETVVRVKLATTDKLMARSNNVLYQILKSPYNHYSPLLEAEEIQRIKNETFDYADNTQGYEPFNLKESSRVRYDLLGGTWTAEDGTSTTRPFGVHQIYEEIVAPLVSNLMQENRVERLKIYNHIHDQKLSYVNKWHQDVDAFYRSNHAESSDIINNMQKTLSEYISSYNVLVQLQKTMDGMKKNQSLDNATVEVEDKSQEALVAFDIERKKYEKVQEDFSAFMDRLQDDIALKAEEFGHVEFYDARLRDGYSNKVAVASYEVSDMDERRKQMALSNPLLAKEALLPPKPNVDSVTYEQLSINLPKMVENALENIEANANNLVTNVSADRETNGQNNVVDNENINENKERF